MNENGTEKELLDRVRECLDREADIRDMRTVRALRSSRLEALDLYGKKRGVFGIPRWITAGGVATALVLAVAVSMLPFSSQKSLPVGSPDDFEILNGNGHPEMYKDLDFYRWLAERGNAD